MTPGAGPDEPSEGDLDAALEDVGGGSGGRVRRRDGDGAPAPEPGPPKPRRWVIGGDSHELVEPGAPPPTGAAPRATSAGPTVVLPRRDPPAYIAPPKRSAGSIIMTIIGLVAFLGLVAVIVLLVRNELGDETVGLASGERQTLDGRSSPVAQGPGEEPVELWSEQLECGEEPCGAFAYQDITYTFAAGPTSATVRSWSQAGDERWSVEVQGTTVAPVAGVGDVILLVTIAGDGSVRTVALETEDGREAWAAPGTVLTFVGDDALLAERRAAKLGVEEGRRLLLVDAVTGRNEWAGSTSSPVLAFGDDEMAEVDGSKVVVRDLDDGDERWSASAGRDPAAVAVADDVVAVARGRRVSTFDASDGAPRTTVTLEVPEGTTISALGAAGDLLLAQAGEETIALDAEDGSVQWTGATALWGELGEAVLVDDDTVLTTDGESFAFASLDSGRRTGERSDGDGNAVEVQGTVVGVDSTHVYVDDGTALQAVLADEMTIDWAVEVQGTVAVGGGLVLDVRGSDLLAYGVGEGEG